MSIVSQTFGLPVHRNLRQRLSFVPISAGLWKRQMASLRARWEAVANVRAEAGCAGRGW